jgi:coenzyme F420-dependent glucose-6-phosphate dehydrogenase
MHPAIVAQAAATSACMMPGRFMLGLGTGEHLNEHITGERWPVSTERLRMLEEAIDVIRMLLKGGNHDHHGRYYTVEDAQLFTVPDRPPPILVASVGTGSAKVAAERADGLISTQPIRDVVKAFDSAGGSKKPKYGQVTVCWARSEEEAQRTALEIWPNGAVSGVTTELPSPWYFEQASKDVDEKRIAENIVCGPDPKKHIAAIKEFFDAGFDHVYVHQVGPDQQGFMQFYNREILRQFD